MKKYLLIIVCALMAFVGNAEAYAEKLALKKPIKIRINFDIARPALNCQDGFGICNAQGGIGRLGGDGRNVGAEASIENGVLTISILKDYVENKLEDELSGTDYYIIDSEVRIPDDIIAKMGLKDSYSIAEGRYRIMQYSDRYEINFELR